MAVIPARPRREMIVMDEDCCGPFGYVSLDAPGGAVFCAQCDKLVYRQEDRPEKKEQKVGKVAQWFTTKKGNQCLKLEDGRYVTVFPNKGRGFKYVCDSNFSNDAWDTEEEAMEAAEAEYWE